MKLITVVLLNTILVLQLLTVVKCRPQYPEQEFHPEPSVQIQKQLMIRLEPKTLFQDHVKFDDDKTTDILKKIDEVNRAHGYTPKGIKSTKEFVQIPSIYSRSKQRQMQEFNFPQNPFANPIFDYISQNPLEQAKLHNNKQVMGYHASNTHENAEILPEDQIPGQFIKRKITHHTSFVLPNQFENQLQNPSQDPNIMTYSQQQFPQQLYQQDPNIMANAYQQFPQQLYQQDPNTIANAYQQFPQQLYRQDPNTMANAYQQLYQNNQFIYQRPQLTQQQVQDIYYQQLHASAYHQLLQQEFLNEFNKNATKVQAEAQTVDNIKNIITQSQPGYYNPPAGAAFLPLQQYYNYEQYNQIATATAHDPVDLNSRQTRQGTINIPFQEFFPIIIRNPFQMMFNAMTSMVEYGQAAPSACGKVNPTIQENRNSKELVEAGKLKYNIEANEAGSEISVFAINSNNTSNDLVIEDLKIPANKKQRSILVQALEREASKRSAEDDASEIKQLTIDDLKERAMGTKTKPNLFKPITWFNHMQPHEDLGTPDDVHFNQQMDKLGESGVQIDEEGDESQKGLFNGENKKIFSRDNTGSGIFIHKLKVKKGGVAIAGPGGIATAGSGGTAIVGPNGFAFTHPDSLAIAGSGTKVVAVDPSISLSDIVNNHKKDGSTPRVGKVVATGPVIYYNKG